jgi:nucleoside-diphosphate-sugar epimerase
MARCLIIGCGCRGSELARGLRAAGHAVRGTTRDPARLAALAADGVDAVLADPDRVATLAPTLDHVAVVYILLGSVTGSDEAISALHTTRLDMLLSKMLDSTVRGIVFEATGTVPATVLESAVGRLSAFAQDSHVPYALLACHPSDHDGWLAEALGALEGVLAPAA